MYTETGSLGQNATPAKKETKEAQLLFCSKGEGLAYAVALKHVSKLINTPPVRKWSLFLSP